MEKFQKNISLLAVTAVFAATASQSAFAHTRLTVDSAMESSASHGTTTTAVNVPHGCGENSVIGNVLFFADTNNSTPVLQTSTDNFQTYETAEGASALDYIVNPPFVRIIKSRDVFELADFINDPLGNPIGFWAGGGELPARNWVGQLPFKITAVAIQPESCASEVVFIPAIANICNITSMDGIDGSDSDNPNVDFWTSPDVESVYSAPSWSYPAKYTVERDLDANPLPESCGEGYAVRIFPFGCAVGT